MNAQACPEKIGLPAEIIPAVITKIGYYHDTLPRLSITISKSVGGNLPDCEGKRVPILLEISGERCLAAIRTTAHSAALQICPDLVDSAGEKVRLVDLIFRHGFDRAVFLELVLIDGELHCFKGTEQQSLINQKIGRLPIRRRSSRMMVCA